MFPVDLRLFARSDFEAPHGEIGPLEQLADEAVDAVVLGGETVVGEKVLVDPLGGESLLQLGADQIAERFTGAGGSGHNNSWNCRISGQQAVRAGRRGTARRVVRLVLEPVEILADGLAGKSDAKGPRRGGAHRRRGTGRG